MVNFIYSELYYTGTNKKEENWAKLKLTPVDES